MDQTTTGHLRIGDITGFVYNNMVYYNSAGLKVIILLLVSNDYQMAELNTNVKYGNSVFNSAYS